MFITFEEQQGVQYGCNTQWEEDANENNRR